MPFNSFDDYPMSWKPSRSHLKRPIYASLADQMEADIRDGVLAPNVKLPPQRELADFLDLNVSTVTKAYKLCESRGLVRATIGRGTFVAPSVRAFASVVDKDEHARIDMGSIHPFYQVNSIVRDAALEVLEDDEEGALFEYTDPLGSPAQIRAGARWLSGLGVAATQDDTLIVSAVQNALAIGLSSLFEPEDKIAVDTYTYPNFISLAKLLHLRLVAVAGDDEGMLPEELDKLCAMQGIRGMYVMPSGANPTNIAMTDARKRQVAEIVRSRGLIVLEDDNQTALLPEVPLPLAAYAPENVVYIGGLSKAVCAGLRIAYMHVPRRYYDAMVQGAYCHNLKVPSLNIQIATRLLESGAAEQIIGRKQQLAIRRNKIFQRAFPSADTCPHSLTQWLKLPAGLSGSSCETYMEAHGISVFGAERFAVGEAASNEHVRVSTCTPKSDADLEQGLASLSAYMANAAARKREMIV